MEIDPKRELLSYAYTFSLILIAVTLPLQWAQLNTICILIMCGLWLVDKNRMQRFNASIRSPLVIGLSSLFFLYLISAVYSNDVKNGFSHLETRFSVFAFPVVLLSYYKIDLKKLNFILAALLISCLLVSLTCVIHTIYYNLINGRSYIPYNYWYYSADSLVRYYGFHTSYFSIYCSFCIFTVIYFYKLGKINLAGAFFLILYFIGFLLMLSSRIGVLAFIIVMIFTMLYESYIRKKIWLGVVLTLLFFLVMGVGIYNSAILKDKLYAMVNYNVNKYTEPFKVTGRLESWESSLQIYKNNLLFGVGIGDAKSELKKVYAEKYFKVPYENMYDSHNLFLETLVSCGLLGLLLLLTIFIISFYQAIHRKNILYMQFLLLFLMLSIPEASFSVQKGIVFFAFINTLFIASMQTEPPVAQQTTPEAWY